MATTACSSEPIHQLGYGLPYGAPEFSLNSINDPFKISGYLWKVLNFLFLRTFCGPSAVGGTPLVAASEPACHQWSNGQTPTPRWPLVLFM